MTLVGSDRSLPGYFTPVVRCSDAGCAAIAVLESEVAYDVGGLPV
jgi:hypothetical protein